MSTLLENISSTITLASILVLWKPMIYMNITTTPIQPKRY